jgi:membrane protease YdiL (CAAX protease family)
MNDSPDDSPPLLQPAGWQDALTRVVGTVLTVLLTIVVALIFFCIRGSETPGDRGPLFAFFLLLAILPILLIMLVAILSQYRGTFQNDAAAAFNSSIVWFAIAAFLLVPPVMSLDLSRLVFVGPPAAVCAALCYANRRRYGQLQRLFAEHPELRTRPATVRRSRSWIWILCGVVGVASLVFGIPSLPHTAEHVDAAQALFELPAGARDVSYYRHGAWIAYEFTTDEWAFRHWITGDRFAPEPGVEKGVVVEEIDEPYTVQRYLLGVLQEAGRAAELDGTHLATVTDGLQYDWSIEDRGVHAAFDRKTGRAYLYIHFY